MNRQRGYTLMELMVTMALAAFLMAMGISTFLSMGRRSATDAALSEVAALVNRARNASARYPATLVVDPETSTLHAFTDEVVQELHFEPRPPEREGEEPVWPMGVDGLDCTLVSGRLDPRGGRVGGGARLEGGAIDCGAYAPYDVTRGLSMEIWVKPERPGRSVVVEKGSALKVSLDSATRGEGTVTVRIGVDDKGIPEPVERIVKVPSVRVGEWLGIGVSYDRRELVVTTDEGYGPVVRDVWKEERPLVIDADRPLLVGGTGFDGWVDDFRFGGIHTAEPLVLPQGVEIVSAAKTIRFLNGRLDPDLHSGPEQIRILADGRETIVEIGQNGTVQDIRFADSPQATEPVRTQKE